MFIIESYSLAVVFCFITMLCWGSWANTQKLATSDWRFELFYWDYVFGIILMCLLLGLTMGSTGSDSRSFFADLAQANSDNLWSAFVGGVVFNIANILLIAALALAGMSVAFPVGIGIALILGVVDNYIKNPAGNPVYLFGGVGLVAIAIILNAFAYRKLAKSIQKVSTKGLLLAVISGCLMGLFYGFVAKSMAKDFANPQPGTLTPYSAVFVMSIGVLISNLFLNTYIMRKPFEGTPVTISDYFKGGIKNHLMGILGGGIWCIGTSFNIIASGKASPAISYGLGQGATVIAAIWGIFIWKEFKNAPEGTSKYINLMLVLYVAGLALIILARQ